MGYTRAATFNGKSGVPVRATLRLYLDGKIQQWYARGDGKGVILIVNAKSVGEAQAVAESLPMAKASLANDEYIELGPLSPLGMLLAPPAATR